VLSAGLITTRLRLKLMVQSNETQSLPQGSGQGCVLSPQGLRSHAWSWVLTYWLRELVGLSWSGRGGYQSRFMLETAWQADPSYFIGLNTSPITANRNLYSFAQPNPETVERISAIGQTFCQRAMSPVRATKVHQKPARAVLI